MSEATDNEPTEGPRPTYEELEQANEARALYLLQHKRPVPSDQMYAVSLLECICYRLGILDQAKYYHEERIAPILDQAVERVTAFEEMAAEQREAAEQAEAEAQVRNLLLGGIPGVRRG